MRSRHRPEYFPSSFYAFCCCRWSQYNCRWLHIDSIRPQLLYSTQTVVVEADGSSVMGRGWKMPPLLSLRVQSNIDLAQAFECKLQFSFIVCDFAVCITCYTANVSFNALLGTVKISMTALIVNIFFCFWLLYLLFYPVVKLLGHMAIPISDTRLFGPMLFSFHIFSGRSLPNEKSLMINLNHTVHTVSVICTSTVHTRYKKAVA